MANSEYITSRPERFPESQSELENVLVYNMWKKIVFPSFHNLKLGDVIYWYDSMSQEIKWKTQIISVHKMKYNDKAEIKKIFTQLPLKPDKKYFDKAANKGVFLGYTVQVINQLSVKLPQGFKMHNSGWKRVAPEIKKVLK